MRQAIFSVNRIEKAVTRNAIRLTTRFRDLLRLLDEECGILHRAYYARPFVGIALNAFSGIAIAYRTDTISLILLLLLSFSVQCLGVCYYFRASSSLRSSLLVLILALFFTVYCAATFLVNEQAARHFLSEREREGQVYDEYTVRVLTSRNPDKSGQSYIVDLGGGVRAVWFSSNDTFDIGSNLYVTGRIQEMELPGNPGEFDRRDYYRRKGILLELVSYDGNFSVDTSSPIRLSAFEHAGVACERLRQFLFDRWTGVIGEDAGLLCGMLWGDTSGMSKDLRYIFRRSNLSHLTAVSGANVSFFLVPVTFFVKKMTSARSTRVFLSLLFLCFFGFLTGWSYSVSRALFPIGCVLVGKLFSQKICPFSLLMCSFCILMCIDPHAAMDYGFRLSFSAVLAILILSPRMTAFLERHFPIPPFISGLLAGTAAAEIGMIPWLLTLNGRLSPTLLAISIGGGLLAEGITLFSVPATIIISAFGAFPATIPFLRIVSLPVQGLLFLLRTLGEIGSKEMSGVLRLASVDLTLLFGTIIILILLFMPRSAFRKVGMWMGVTLVVIGTINTCWNYLCLPELLCVYADVGQGDCALVMTKDGKNILIDGGVEEMGEDVVLPLLDFYGIDAPDVTVLTHAHADHGGGFIELASVGRLDSLAVSGLPEKSELDALFSVCKNQSTQIQIWKKGDRIQISDQISMEVISPEPGSDGSGNEDSLVVLLHAEQTDFLFTGDIGEESEEKLLLQPGLSAQLEATDILKVAHHGSRYSSTEDFLSAVTPKAAIISVGRNQYGHPSDETIGRLNDISSDIYRTDRGGAVMVRVYSDYYSINSYRDEYK